MTLHIAGLAGHHDRYSFDCGEPALNTYLQRFARQQGARDVSRTYVAKALDEPRIQGFYSAGSASMVPTNFGSLPSHLSLPRHPVPVLRMGRLAVDLRSQEQDVGDVEGALLRHAMVLAVELAQQIGLHAAVVDAKHEEDAAFYLRYGFQRFDDQNLSLFLTTEVIRRAVAASGDSH